MFIFINLIINKMKTRYLDKSLQFGWQIIDEKKVLKFT